MNLTTITDDFAEAIGRVDATRPRAVSRRTGIAYREGIGPFSETEAVSLITADLRAHAPERYASQISTNVKYPGASRQKCDICLGADPTWHWAIEVKLLRLMGDNGKPNNNMLMHLLSPYPQDRSALTDCTKLVASALGARRAILVYGFDYPGLSMDAAVEAFEVLAGSAVQLGQRHTAVFTGLVHEVQNRGRVFAWEVAAFSTG